MLDPLNIILETAAKTPDAPAIYTKQANWSYRALMQHMRAYAGVFNPKDAPCIAVALPQENHSYAAFLGAGLAGGYYSPLNTLSPLDKLGRIISRLQPDFIVARPPLLEDLSGFAPDARLIDPDQLDLSVQLKGKGSRHDWAYVNSTSGSNHSAAEITLSHGLYIARIAVADEFRRTGLGSSMFRQFEKMAQGQSIALHVDRENALAIGFYKRLGFAFTDDADNSKKRAMVREVVKNKPDRFNC